MAKTKYGNLTSARAGFGTPVEVKVTEDKVRNTYKAFPKMPNEHEEVKNETR